MNNVFLPKITQGQLDWGEYNLARFHEACKQNEGKTVRIEIVKPTRSINQNSFYWLYLELIERETGNNANELHEYFKRVFLPPRRIKVLGKDLMIPSSTTKLKKLEFSEYMDKICAETLVPIPDAKTYKEFIFQESLRID